MNSLFVIHPYKTAYGAWVFDDPSRGIVQEPFVAGADYLLDVMCDLLEGDPKKGLRVYFSESFIPEFSVRLDWQRAEVGWNFYTSEIMPYVGLCPCLSKFFPSAPKKIFVKAEKI